MHGIFTTGRYQPTTPQLTYQLYYWIAFSFVKFGFVLNMHDIFTTERYQSTINQLTTYITNLPLFFFFFLSRFSGCKYWILCISWLAMWTRITLYYCIFCFCLWFPFLLYKHSTFRLHTWLSLLVKCIWHIIEKYDRYIISFKQSLYYDVECNKPYIYREFENYGLDSGITFANWLVVGFPLSLVCFVFLWAWMQFYFAGPRYVDFILEENIAYIIYHVIVYMNKLHREW